MRAHPGGGARSSCRAAYRALALVALAATALAPAAAQDVEGSRAVVLFHHPDDKVDPFGVPYLDRDTFAARHGRHSRDGVFDFPTYVADGVLAVSRLPDPDYPDVATLANYSRLVEERLATGPGGTLALSGAVTDGAVELAIRFEPATNLATPGDPGALRLMAAVVEDFIHYQPEAPISNGVDIHRLTVRALQDLGPLTGTHAEARNASFALGSTWDQGQVIVAAWVEARAPFGRFGEGEVLQAAWARANGTEVVQAEKAVLVEMYSATWCSPCLFGDLAASEVAAKYGGAARLPEPSGPTYLRLPGWPDAAALASFAACAIFAVLALRRSP